MSKKILGAGSLAVLLAMLYAMLIVSGGARHRDRSVYLSGQRHTARLSYVRSIRQAAPAQLSAEDTQALYEEKCSLCHGLDKTGKPPTFPSLIGVTSRYSDADIAKQISNGKGRMPAFPSLTLEEVHALVKYLKPSATMPAVDQKTPASLAKLLHPRMLSK